MAILTHANGVEIGDRGVGARKVPRREHRRQTDHTSARRPGRCDACRGVLENDTRRRILPEALGSELVAVGGRLALRHFFAGYDDLWYRQSDSCEAPFGERASTGRHDGPAGVGENGQKRAGARHCSEASDVGKLHGVDPRRFAVGLEVRGSGPYRVAGAAAVRNSQDLLGIETVALGPQTTHALHYRAGIDQHTVQVEQKRRTSEVHPP